MKYGQTKSLKVSDITHKHLRRIGRKEETFDEIISRLVQEHLLPIILGDIKKIEEICGDRDVNPDTIVEDIKTIFFKIDYDMGIYPEWDLSEAVEIAMKEDDDIISLASIMLPLPKLSEMTIRVYLMYLEMRFIID